MGYVLLVIALVLSVDYLLNYRRKQSGRKEVSK